MHTMTSEDESRRQRSVQEAKAVGRYGRLTRERIRSTNQDFKDAVARYERKYQQAVERQILVRDRSDML